MTRDVISVMEGTSVDEVRFLLVNRKIKRLPVLRGLMDGGTWGTAQPLSGRTCIPASSFTEFLGAHAPELLPGRRTPPATALTAHRL